MVVSRRAFLEVPWLEAGLHLLRSTGLGFDRDYLVPLPTETLDGTNGLRATYSDALGLSQDLLKRLERLDGQALHLPQAAHFWTEHSERAGCSSWLAALGVDDGQRGFLGRWAVTKSANAYVRTASRVVEDLQNLAARAARASLAGGPDWFGEEAALEDLRAFLQSKGVEKTEADWQVKRLTSANPELPIVSVDEWERSREEAPENEGGWVDHEEDATLETVASSGCPAASVQETEAFLRELEKEEAADSEGEEDATPSDLPVSELEAAAAARLEAARQEPPWGFVVAKTTKKVRCLHFIGACGKKPGIHYFSFDVWGDMMPPEAEIDTQCGTCFKEGVPVSLSPGVPIVEVEPATSSCSSPSSSQPASADEREERVISLKRRRKGASPPGAEGPEDDLSD